MIDLFEKYMTDELAAEERAELINQLTNDQSIQKEFTAYLLARQAVVESEEYRLRQSIQAAEQAQKKVVTLRRYIAIAASVILVLGASYFV